MVNPLLIFRVGHMEDYRGPGPISGGGSHITEHGEGGEMWNFLPEGGWCYGFAMTRNFSGLDLNKVALAPNGKWKRNDELQNVDIIFIARKTRQVVVGYYKNATIFHKAYRQRPLPGSRNKELTYLCQVEEQNAVVIPAANRGFVVPYAPASGKGYPGHSNIWYGRADNPNAVKLVNELHSYIEKTPPKTLPDKFKKPRKGGWSNPLDKESILAIEKRAMEATIKHYEGLGYRVQDICRDNRGWDLTAVHRKRGNELYLEVKGHLGNVVHFELTPNEYATMQQRFKNYRVCVVREALKNNKIEIYSPVQESGEWKLKMEKGTAILALGERTAARASQLECVYTGVCSFLPSH